MTTKLVAVTACPTGIAHTYMAQESLLRAAEKMGVEIKVETQGASGVEQALTEEDIRAADAVIIAADKAVDLDRFHGKRLLQTSVTSAIKAPQQLIEDALKQPVCGAERGSDYLSQVAEGKAQKKASMPAGYRHLMNGVSHMLPLVVAGGIFIALSFAVDIDNQSPLAQAFMNIGSKSAFALFVPILAAFIAQSIGDRPAFAAGLIGGWIGTQGWMFGDDNASAGYLGGILAGFLAGYVTKWLKQWIRLPRALEGLMPVLILPVLSVGIVGLLMIFVLGSPIAAVMQWMKNGLDSIGATGSVGIGLLLGAMMAFDMGGPVNKVAYLFAVGLLGSHTHESEVIMAAVMGAGMVPPLAVSFATFINKRKFLPEEREAGKVALVLGACFITEGAIPFATNDPFRVIPSIMVGSAVTGALSMLFQVTLPAPHGGIFVFPLIGNVVQYILAILIGAVVSAGLILVLKKPVMQQDTSVAA
ncbi:PTS fructose transporter subunit IIBC [Alicyclobacillus contaminans]|uniref:PTS fructose transporter subunit IIC n=1 Tax=Alicyclobacillus contaminans TaxID=392016 RepID=UPI000400BF4E|nr:fructose-specific PTS transporter subunit EIIC [Alicyclobacillus contaminans]GMA49445.1 PTS fructose transporter subunit IIBC [Alicyclobacillus contaminans]